MPKYIIEGGIDFYEELNQPEPTPKSGASAGAGTDANDDNDDNDTKSCLLTKTPLTYGHITLPCTHTFNFLPLYNEVLSQKTNPELLKNVYHIRMSKNHIKCPYCRTIHADSLLPYIMGSCNKRVTGVNGPVSLCMPTPFKCQHAVSKNSGRGKKKQLITVECTAIKNIYYCINGGGVGGEDAKFLCKKHCPS